MKKIFPSSTILFLILAMNASLSGQTNISVNDDGPDAICLSAWPAEILGNYYQNGTNNGKACYEGPNGYWLYHASMGSGVGDSWVVGKPLGSTNINGADVRHYTQSTAATPPLNSRFTSTSNGCGYIKISDAGALPPPAPDLNNPYDVGATSMKLSWSQEPGTTEYHVYVSTNSSFTAMVSGLNPKSILKGENPYTPTNTTLSGLSRGTKYYIRVRSYSGAGESGNSNTVSASTSPEAPNATAANEIADITFKANWDDASQATSYKLYVSENSSFSSHISDYNGKTISSTSHTVTGVMANKDYYYRIKALNNSGTSVYSNIISLKTACPAPANNSASNITATGFKANWNSSSEATGYYLDVSTSSSFSSYISGFENKDVGNSLSFSISGLATGTIYYYQVRSYNSAGTSTNSSAENLITIPGSPTATDATTIQIGSFQANWNSEMGTTDYKLDVATDISFSNILTNYNNLEVGDITTYTVDSNINAGAEYFYRVKATNSSGTSAYSNIISLTTIPAPPLIINANQITQTSFKANWSSSSGATGYYLDVSTNSSFSSYQTGYENKNVGSNLSELVTGLSTGTIYYYRVRSYTSTGTSANSTSSNLITIPDSPTATNATTKQMGSFIANWSSEVGATGYKLDVATDTSFSNMISGYNNLDVGDVSNYAVNSNINAGTNYYYRVRAYNATGTSNNSNSISLETAPNPPSIQASNIILSTIKPSKITLSWINGNGSKRVVFAKKGKTGSAVPENYHTYSPHTRFTLGDQIGTTGWFCVYNGTGSTVEIEGLIPCSDYIFMISEFNGSSSIETYNTSTTTDNTKSQLMPTIMINEVDADTPGSDDQEFIELYDGGIGNTSLDGLVLVLYDGSLDQSYKYFDLSGKSTNSSGYYVVGNIGVYGVGITFTNSTLQDGADAVALYAQNPAYFSNPTAVTTSFLVDALVYDTDDSDDAGLLVLLNAGQPQVDEDGNRNKDFHSNQRIPNGAGGLRNTVGYDQQPPTPGARNNALPTSANGSISASEDVNKTIALTNFTFNDADGDSLFQIQLITKPAKGSLFLDTNDDGVINAGEELVNNDTILRTEIVANKLKYRALLNESGSPYTTFEFKVHDSLAYSALSYNTTINVAAVNDLPMAANDTVTTPEDTDKVFAASDFNYSDVEGSTMQQIQITLIPDDGILFNDANTNGVVNSGEELSNNDVVTKAHIDANQLKFKPNLNEFGSPYTSFNFKAHDGIAYSDTAYKLTIDVMPINDVPTSTDSSFGCPINTDHIINSSEFIFNDVDGDDLNSVLIVSIPVNGIIYYDTNDNGIMDAAESIGNNIFVTRAMLDSNKLKYKPITNENGQPYTTFTFKVNDGTVSSSTTYIMTISVFPEFVVGGIAEDMIICHNSVPNPITGLAPTGGNTPYTYQWQSSSDNSTFSDISGATNLDYQPTVLTDTTYFRQIQTSSSGCGTRITNTVTIYTLEELIAGNLSSNQSICFNTIPVKLTGTASNGGKPPYTYQWQSSTDGVIFTDITGETTLEFQPVALTQTTYYRILQTSSSSCGTVATNDVKVHVYDEFKAGSISETQVLYYRTLPDKFIGVAPSGGTTPYTYQWQQSTDGTNFTDIIYGGNQLNYQAGRLSRTTYFRLAQSSASGCGSEITNSAAIIVFPEFKVGSIEANQQIAYGSIPEKLSASKPRGGRQPYTYQWQSATDSINFTDIVGETSLDYQAPALSRSTHYRQIQSAALGYADKATNVVTITVFDEFKVGGIAGDQVVCYNSAPELIIGTEPTGGDLPYTYQWQSSSDGVTFVDIADATSLNYQPPTLTGKKYYRQVQTSASDCGSFSTNAVVMTIQQQPVVDINVDEATICANASYQLAATVQNHESVTWISFGDGSFNNVNILNPTYTPGVNDIVNGSVILAINAIGISPCEMLASDQMILSFYDSPVVDAGSDLTVYENSEIELNATVNGNGNYTYTWSPADMVSDPTILNPVTSPITQTTTFTLQVVDNSTGCSVEDQITIKVEPGVFYQISGMVQSIGLKNSLPSTTISFTGIEQSTTTNNLGEYIMMVPAGYSGWAIPTRPGYIFDPDSIGYLNVGEDIIAEEIGGTFYLIAKASPDSIIAGQSVQLSVELVNSTSSIVACSWQDETGEFCNDVNATVKPTQSTLYTVHIQDDFEKAFDTIRVYVSTTTGINDLKPKDATISMYPNPTRNIINLEISSKADAALISIISPNGNLLKQIKLPKTSIDHQVQINLEHLIDGTYYLLITNNKGKRIGSIKVVKI